MQPLTLSFVLASLDSERAKYAVASAAFFGSVSSLRGHAGRLESYTRTINNIQDRYPDRAERMRSASQFKDLEEKVNKAANKCACIHAMAEAHNIMLKLEFEPPLPKDTSEEELKAIAEAGGSDIEQVRKNRRLTADRQYARDMEAADFAASFFWSATPDSDAMVKFDTIDKAIARERTKLESWSTVDYAELAMLKDDLRKMNSWMETMSDDPSDFIEDEETEQFRAMETERKLLDAHAKREATIRYLDAERTKAAKPKRTRVAKSA